MQLASRVVLIKKLKAGQTLSYGQTYSLKHDSNVGVVAIGYADGYSRIFSNCAFVRIGKELYQVSGRVCMDQFMIDLGNQTQVERWDQVVLFGPYANGPDAWDLAQLMKSIPYEVTCLVSKRVPRIYSEDSAYFS
jgi:alanine racemase